MITFEWRPFLEQWSRAILASPDASEFGLPPDVIASGWLGYPPATDDQIAAVEARLGVTLPPSYKAFLKITNGWRHAGGSIERILPVEEIDWLRVLHPDWIAAWTMFGPAEYDPEVDPVDLRHMPETLAISAIGDAAILLLNPAVKTSDGEWEAWFFANWLPGAEGFDSFRELLEDQYETLLEISREEMRRPRPGEPAERIITKLPELLGKLEERRAVWWSESQQEDFNDSTYRKGIAEGLEAVIAQVRAIQEQNLEPQTLRDRLKTLATDLEREGAQGQARMQASVNTGDLLGPLLNPAGYSLSEMLNRIMDMAGSIYAFGKIQGKREGAGVIQWFLNG